MVSCRYLASLMSAVHPCTVDSWVAAGKRSVARRLLRAATQQLANANVARAMATAESVEDIRAVLAKHAGFKLLDQLAEAVLQPAAEAAQARERLMALADRLRALDVACRGGHTAAADLLVLYASTRTWFAAEREYKVRRGRWRAGMSARHARPSCTQPASGQKV